METLKNNKDIGDRMPEKMDQMANDKTNVSLISGDVKEPPKSERGQWSNQAEFILSSLGYAVGLGNIWRFPYLCMRNGGGAFLIPYFLSLLFCGVPLFILEVAIGQFSGLSPLQIWCLCPLMKGLGYAMVMITIVCCLYYNIIICWTLYYLIKSFTKSLPWSKCGNSWNSALCLVRGVTESISLYNETSTISNNISYNLLNATQMMCSGTACDLAQENSLNMNATEGNGYDLTSSNGTVRWRTPAEEYWNNKVLGITDGIENLGGVKWDLFGTFFLCWLIVFLCLFKGVKTSGKVVYVTATVPYVFITALLIRSVTLPGAMDGIKFYIIPDWNKLLELQVWGEAMLQILYTLGPGWGGIITMASYNKFNNNCLRDGIMVPLVTCFTSFYAGFVIFSVLGYMANKTNLPVKDVVSSGPGLAFIAYPEAVSTMPISPLWAVCFFAMLLSVGLDSMFTTLETLTSSIVDAYPKLLRKYKTWFIGAVCLASFLLGIPFVTRGGMYCFQLIDWYITVPLLFICLLEFITLSWLYGTARISDDIELMTGYRPSAFWKIFWLVVSPVLILSVTVYSFAGLKVPTYGDYTYPLWSVIISWCFHLIPVLFILLGSVHTLMQQKGSFMQRLRASIKPSSKWGPSDPVYRLKYDHLGQNGMTWTKTKDSADQPLKVIT